MNFDKFIEMVKNRIALGIKEDNPLWIAEAKGMISGVLTLLHDSMLTKYEKLEILQLYNECSLMLIVMARKEAQ